MSTNLEYRAWKRLRKSGRPAKLNERKGDRDLEREIKNNGDIFLLQEHENFVAAVTKWEMLASTNARRKCAAVNENTYDISSIKRFLEVSPCSRAKQRQRNLQKKCAARAKLLLLIRPFLFFQRSQALPSPLFITRFYILFEQTINIIESFPFSPG